MAKQKQINLQVLLLMTGVFFTALSAAKACFVPYVSIYLRQLGLSAMQVGIILGCQGLVVACTASCIGRFLIRFKSARVFLLLAIILYLGGVLGFTIIPTSSTVLFQVYCVGFADNLNSTSLPGVVNTGILLLPNGSHQLVSNVATSVPSPTLPKNIVTTAKMKNSPTQKEINVQVTTQVSESLVVSIATIQKDRNILTKDSGRRSEMENTMDEEPPESAAEPQYENMLKHDSNEFDTQGSSPTVETFLRSHHRPAYNTNNRPYPKVQEDPYLPGKRYRGQQLHRDQTPGRYMESEDTRPKWDWQRESETDFDRGRYPTWDWNEEQEELPTNGNENDGYNEDVLNWLLRNGVGRSSSRGQQYLRHRAKRSSGVMENDTTGISASEANDITEQFAAEETKKKDDATSSGVSSTFWLALLVVVITGVCAGPIEHMCDTALYHQLDNIDELDKYKRPSLLTMPVFAVMGLVSALVVDSTACFLNGNSSHMAIHFYLSAAFIGVVFLVGIIVPLSHKIKNQQEGRYIKSIKFLYSDGHTAVMCATLVVTAMISSCSDGFLFWLIQDLHGLETTMGVSLAVAYMTELPMSMVFTPWLVGKLGNVWLLSLGTACLGLQNLYYSVLWTPWAVVPIQVLHALGRSAIRGCILAFLNEASPPGMGKAIQVTVLALEQGVGMALGSILWGGLYGVVTVKLIFVGAAIMALIWTVILMICACRLPTKKRFMYAKLLQSDMEMDMKGGGFGSDSDDNEEKQWLHDAIRDEEDEEE